MPVFSGIVIWSRDTYKLGAEAISIRKDQLHGLTRLTRRNLSDWSEPWLQSYWTPFGWIGMLIQARSSTLISVPHKYYWLNETNFHRHTAKSCRAFPEESKLLSCPDEVLILWNETCRRRCRDFLPLPFLSSGPTTPFLQRVQVFHRGSSSWLSMSSSCIERPATYNWTRWIASGQRTAHSSGVCEIWQDSIVRQKTGETSHTWLEQLISVLHTAHSMWTLAGLNHTQESCTSWEQQSGLYFHPPTGGEHEWRSVSMPDTHTH